MRSTSGADAFYADDRAPDDATFVTRLRAAGAIILAKANLAEYANGGARSSFGGTFCNPYDTERSPSNSSAGSGSSVAANLVTCAIAEETGSSIRGPARANNAVGIAPTQELISRDGMIQPGINTRVGPICRNVRDAAKILSAYAGYDAKDELTVFSVGRMPPMPYEAYAAETRLDGVRIGVVRELFDKTMLTPAVARDRRPHRPCADRSRKHRRRDRRSRRRQCAARVVRAQVRPEARRSPVHGSVSRPVPGRRRRQAGRRPHRHARWADTRSVEGARELFLHGAAARHSGRREQVLDEPVSRRARRRASSRRTAISSPNPIS